jgi:hypothetical protein
MALHQHVVVAATGPAAPQRQSNPTNDLADVASAGQVDQQNGHPNSALAVEIRKAWLNTQAKFLMASFPATLIDDDAGMPLLVVSRWALTRSFSSVAEAEAWLARVGGHRHG